MVQIKVEVYPWLTELLGGGRSQHMIMDLTVPDGETVRSLLDRLAQEHPDFAQRALEGAGVPSTMMSLFLNDRFLELAGGLDTPFSNGDSLTLIPAWEGGSGLLATVSRLRDPCSHPETEEGTESLPYEISTQ